MQKIIIGPGFKQGTEMGPLISQEAVKNLKRKVDDAILESTDCILGGNPLYDLGSNFFSTKRSAKCKSGF